MDGLSLAGLVGTLVGTLISIIALLASISFYHKGSKLQGEATTLLASISEKANSIQKEISSVTSKSLDAALKQPDVSAILKEVINLNS